MTKYTIIPANTRQRPQPARKMSVYPWSEMDIGDSFDIELDGSYDKSVRQRVYHSATTYRAKSNPTFKVSTIKIDDVIQVYRDA